MSRVTGTSPTTTAAFGRLSLGRPAALLGLAIATTSCGDDQPQTPGGPAQTSSVSATTQDTPVSPTSTPSPTTSGPSQTTSASTTPITTTSSTASPSASASTSNTSPITPNPSTPEPVPSTEAESSADDETSTTSAPAEPSSDVNTEPLPGSAAAPSPGCTSGNADAMLSSGTLDKPSGYDGATPVPVLFAFHGAGGNASSLQGPFASDAKSRGYLGVYLKSSGSAWSIQADTAVVDAAFETIAQNYCVDLNRVFAVGHSSGAQMITQLLCAKEDRFRAVAPVASSKYCNGWDATAAIVIHGVDDIERGGQGENRYGLDDGDGHIDFGVYRESNECTEASTAFDPGGNCGANIDPGCVEYDDCAARTVFCNHNDPQYGTSNHGVPCFASKVMFDFFDEFH